MDTDTSRTADNQDQDTCPECGTEFGPGELKGFCPVCLLGEARSSAGETTRITVPEPVDLNVQVEDYEILELVGAGGMGAVYRARQLNLDRDVALKLLTLDPKNPLNFADRFHHEAKAMAGLNHPHIVHVYDFGETADGRFFFTMELIDGSDLRSFVKDGAVKPADALRWVVQVAEALRYAHGRSVVHRDIKPSNILITAGGDAKVADLGLAKLTDDSPTPPLDLTATDLTLGTPDYAAPEQISRKGGVIDHRADLYSLGVILYELLTGERPRGAWEPPSAKSPDVHSGIDAFVKRALQRNPDDRYPDAAAFIHDLDRIRSAPLRRRRLLKTAALVVGGGGALAAAAFATREKFGGARPIPVSRPEAEIVTQHSHRINNIGLLPDGGRVVALGDDGTLLFPNDADSPPRKLDSIKPNRLKMTVFGDDRLLVGNHSRSIYLCDSGTGEVERIYETGENVTFSLFASPDGDAFLRFCAYDSRWWLFRKDQGAVEPSRTGGPDQETQVFAAVFLPDGEHFVFAAGTGDRFKKAQPDSPRTITIARIGNDEPVAVFGESRDGYHSLAVSDDGHHLIAGGADGSLSKFSLADLEAPELLGATPPSRAGKINHLNWLPDAKSPTVVSTSENHGRISFYSLKSLEEIHRIDLDRANPRRFVISPEERALYFHGWMTGSRLGNYHTPDKCRVYRVALPERLFARR